MKKLVVALMTLVMAFSLVACGGNDTKKPEDETNTPTSGIENTVSGIEDQTDGAVSEPTESEAA